MIHLGSRRKLRLSKLSLKARRFLQTSNWPFRLLIWPSLPSPRLRLRLILALDFGN